MEEAHRKHKEPAWGWVAALLQGYTSDESAKGTQTGIKTVRGATRSRGIGAASARFVAPKGRSTP